MRRQLRLILAGLLAAVALLVVPLALDQVYLDYLLPSIDGTTRLRQVFAPGVVAAVVAGLVALGTLARLVLAVVRPPTRNLWWVVTGLVVLDVVVLTVVSNLPHPAF